MASRLREDAIAIWRAGVAAVDPYRLVRESICSHGRHLAEAKRVAVVGAGKAGAAMARAVADTFEPILEKVTGHVNVPNEMVESLPAIRLHGARTETDNRPTAEGVEGSRRILEMASSLGENDALLVLLSGGGSALLPLPVEGVTLEDKVRMTALLQERGVPIGGMNAVRKHLSRIKGGRLAAATKARVVSLILSDVRDDRLDVIASGPTAPDPTTFSDALNVIDKFALWPSAPHSVLLHLTQGAAARIDETPKTLPDRVANVVIGNNRTAREGAAAAAEELGYRTVDWGEFYGDANEFPRWLAGYLRGLPTGERVCAISGGETTVALPEGHGRGGRNQHSVLQVLATLGPAGLRGRCFLSAGTDGEDGPTDAAGAIADEALARRAAEEGLDREAHLRHHDSYAFFEPLGGLFKTGLTGTNVMDLRVVIAGGS